MMRRGGHTVPQLAALQPTTSRTAMFHRMHLCFHKPRKPQPLGIPLLWQRRLVWEALQVTRPLPCASVQQLSPAHGAYVETPHRRHVAALHLPRNIHVQPVSGAFSGPYLRGLFSSPRNISFRLSTVISSILFLPRPRTSPTLPVR